MAEDKIKILNLMKLLMEETDSEHPMNASQICNILEDRYGYAENRKTVYADIERLRDFGIDIRQYKGSSHGYYVGERMFDLPELKLLVDAVQASKFITVQKSAELIKKLETLTSRENGKSLQRQVFIYNRTKAGNETIFKNVDAIHAALYENRRIRFKYCEWTVKKDLRRKRGGEDYVVSPWALTWDSENYYLVAYEEETDKIKHYRVDKMEEISIEEEARLGKELFDNFDLAAYAKKTFGMYGGAEVDVTLECGNNLAGVIIDRFGRDVMMIPSGPDHFKVGLTVVLSPQFFGWMAGIGKDMRITRPQSVKDEYKEYLTELVSRI